MTEAALSRRLLERRFKDVTGKTLYEYITELKLKYFAEQLQETDEQVMSIALSMGENDTKSIARRFKQIYGCTPLQWREKQRKQHTT
jgi:LacI family transcriptional regulator